MSSATDGYIEARPAPRPAGLIAGIAVLEALTVAIADYSAVGGLGAALPWLLLDIYLLRRIWIGSSVAWFALVTLNVGVVAVAASTLFVHNLHVDGGPLLLARLGLELALLAAPGMRRWVAQG
ncbi:hypothetical protein ABH926_000410 [Catenulispora sp. GP43]|uniref:hypothetical protein n=1 Tax=Catenulispora sp. GP43 TaxID=3156263 RepID=UPI00351350D2